MYGVGGMTVGEGGRGGVRRLWGAGAESLFRRRRCGEMWAVFTEAGQGDRRLLDKHRLSVCAASTCIIWKNVVPGKARKIKL